uniref:Envelopment polyprotein n=1 Tax=Soybean vein necrosis virus TaxID=980895 RepID=A0A7H1KW32_9VIRU|nr:glycoprotein precursor [Soybean vein necrosis virus]
MRIKDFFVIMLLFGLNLVFLSIFINASIRGDHEVSQETSFEELSKEVMEAHEQRKIGKSLVSSRVEAFESLNKEPIETSRRSEMNDRITQTKPDIDDQMIPKHGEGKREAPPPSKVDLSCANINPENCKVVGKTPFNFYYQISDSEETISCLSSKVEDLKACNPQSMHIFTSAPVLPITTILNKRVLSVGSKYYIQNSIDSSSFPVQDSGNVQLGLVNIYSVRLTGECNITKVSLTNPFFVTLTSSNKETFYSIKKIGADDVNLIKFSGEKTVELPSDSVDGNHVLLCGDRVSEIPKIDVNKRNCLVKYKGKRYQQSACVHFNILRYLLVSIILFVPVSWFLNKTKDPMFLWYDFLGIIFYPILYILNWLWRYFPMKCSNCGNFSLITHSCYDTCVCNKSKAKSEHAENCPIITGKAFSKSEDQDVDDLSVEETESLTGSKKPKKASSKFRTFQLVVNTKISTGFLMFVTKVLLGFLIFSQMPKTMASKTATQTISQTETQVLCVSYCSAKPGCNKFLFKNEEVCIDNPKLKCNCLIRDGMINEEAYINGTRYSVSMVDNCLDRRCEFSSNKVEDLLACRLGCGQLKKLKSSKLQSKALKQGIVPRGASISQIYSSLRLQDGYIDSEESLHSLGDLPENKVKVEDEDIPEGVLPRQSFVYNSIVDGKYRYLISMDAIQSTGYVYSMNDAKMAPPQELVVFVKEAGVTYTMKTLYYTAPISATHTHVYSTCTGNCETCRKEHPISGYQDYCIAPTSNWGCEELGCLAIGEGATCGYCRNVYDLSKKYSVRQILTSHVTVKVCFKGFAGTGCQTITDSVPFQNSYYQLSIDADLHNDDLTAGSRVAVDPNGMLFKGNIANLKDSSLAFGHPQLNELGVLMFAKANLELSDFTWSCAVIGNKKVDVKKCGYDTFHQYIGLEPISDYFADEIDDGTMFVKKDFKIGKINLIVDLPSELFQTIAKKPKVAMVASACRGCLSCSSGINCDLEFTSDSIFSCRISWEHCTSEPEQIAMKKGTNVFKLNMFCSKDPTLTKIILVPSDDESMALEFETKNVEISDPETIIDHNDDAFNEEVEYDSDTSFKSVWDYIKSPFNWVASFFGDFFEIVRVLLVLTCCAVLFISISKLYEICHEYYSQEQYKKSSRKKEGDLEDDDEKKAQDDIIKSLRNQVTEDTTYKRNSNKSTRKAPFDDLIIRV